ncbi:MAG: hypothetical protein R6V27_03810 [Balneolaceae bacterium]
MSKEPGIFKKLYPLAQELQKMAPWEFMYERELFGIQLPDSDEPWFASVMGSTGEFCAVSFYEGVEAAHQFLRIQEDPYESDPMEVLLIPHLMVSFEDIQYMEPEDKDRLRSLGYKLRNKTKWPVLKEVVPGCIHVTPETDKLEQLQQLMEQVMNVASRVGRQEFAWIEHTSGGMSGLVRVPDGRTKSGWRDDYKNFDLKPVDVLTPVSKSKVKSLNRLPKNNLVLQAGMVLIPSPIGDKHPPYFPFLLLLVEKENGYILSPELMTPHPSVKDMFARSGEKMVEFLTEQKIHPVSIEYCSVRLQPVLEAAFKNTSVELRKVEWMPAFDDAAESMINHFMGGE